MRLIFAGTPDTALPLLEAVAALEDHEIVGVLTARMRLEDGRRNFVPLK